jgi:hypothetical protein
MSAGRWFRDVYRDAVWESETLTANEKAVAETYARHARDVNGQKSASADTAWVEYQRLMAKAGIGRRANVSAATKQLVKDGWLVIHRQSGRRPTVYRLAIPLGGSDSGTTEASSDGGTTVVPMTDHGSSTQSDSYRSRSSDGGTQPLEDLPLKKSPSSSAGHAPLEALRARLGADLDDDEIEWIHQKIKDMAGGPIRKSFAAYLGGIPDADLNEYRRQYRNREPDLYDVPWCEDCDGPKTRRVHRESSYGEGVIRVPCPACNPYRDVPAGQAQPDPDNPNKMRRSYDCTAPGAADFWGRTTDRPYRNPTDPHAYDDYEAGPRR